MMQLVTSLRHIWLVLLLATVCGTPLCAHPISLSQADVEVTPQQVTAKLSILLEDLVLYYGLPADGEARYAVADFRRTIAKHRKFLLRDFHIRDGDGQRLDGTVVEVDQSELPTDLVPQSELKTRALHFKLRYRTVEPLQFLSVSQTFGGAKAVLPALMDVFLSQQGVLLEPPEQIHSGQQYTVRLDWSRPPRPVRNWKALREQRRRQREQRLGIGSYTGLYSFIYIGRYEVRHEILLPVLTLENWVKLLREDPDYLSIAEQTAAAPRITRVFQRQNPVVIDGARVQPTLSRLSFFGLDINDFATNAPARRVSVHQARVGIILSYPTKGPPRSLRMDWELFSQHASFLRSIIYVYDEDPGEHTFLEQSPRLEWRDPLEARHRTISAPETVHNRRGPLSDKEAAATLSAILNNVYRAFDYRADEQVYDALSHSVEGDLLRQLYLQIKRSLVIAEQGGAVARVLEVRPTEHTLMSSEATSFDMRMTWNVTGSVEHWGHIHSRRNEHQADFTVNWMSAGWKLTGFRLTHQKRIGFDTRLRMLDD